MVLPPMWGAILFCRPPCWAAYTPSTPTTSRGPALPNDGFHAPEESCREGGGGRSTYAGYFPLPEDTPPPQESSILVTRAETSVLVRSPVTISTACRRWCALGFLYVEKGEPPSMPHLSVAHVQGIPPCALRPRPSPRSLSSLALIPAVRGRASLLVSHPNFPHLFVSRQPCTTCSS